MKKITSIFGSILLIAALTGCNVNEPVVSDDSGQISAPVSDNSSDPDKTSAPENSDITESKIPSDEPAFLTCPDGTVIHMSDITRLQSTYYNVENKRDEFPIEMFGEESFKNNDYEAACSGFAYAFMPQVSYNCVQNPDLFKKMPGVDEGYYEYIGDYPSPSGGYFRAEPGDKIGELTVTKAETVFSGEVIDRYPKDDYADINGFYIYTSKLEFDGELELTGYLHISRANEGYDRGGDMRFTPGNECLEKLPSIGGFAYDGAFSHFAKINLDGNAVNEFGMFSLGNMHDYDLYFDGLEEGERYAPVKITIDEIKLLSNLDYVEVSARLLEIVKL